MSLASGTFCAACQALFLFAAAISAACRAPERRTAKMKISYTFANGDNSEVEVNEDRKSEREGRNAITIQ